MCRPGAVCGSVMGYREQAQMVTAQAEKIAAQARRSPRWRRWWLTCGSGWRLLIGGSRNSGNSSMPPSSDDLPGRKPPRKQRRAAERRRRRSAGSSLEPDVHDVGGPGPDRGSPSRGAARAAVTWRMPLTWGCPCSQQEEIPAARGAVQHDLHESSALRPGACRGPPGGRAGFRAVDRPRLRALAVYLVVFQHVPVERCLQLIADVTGALVSDGFVHSCLRRQRRWPRTWCG